MVDGCNGEEGMGVKGGEEAEDEAGENRDKEEMESGQVRTSATCRVNRVMSGVIYGRLHLAYSIFMCVLIV